MSTIYLYMYFTLFSALKRCKNWRNGAKVLGLNLGQRREKIKLSLVDYKIPCANIYLDHVCAHLIAAFVLGNRAIWNSVLPCIFLKQYQKGAE